jgi:hypothetical protein
MTDRTFSDTFPFGSANRLIPLPDTFEKTVRRTLGRKVSASCPKVASKTVDTMLKRKGVGSLGQSVQTLGSDCPKPGSDRHPPSLEGVLDGLSVEKKNTSRKRDRK